MTGSAAETHDSGEPGADMLGLADPWWLHPRERPAAINPATRDVLREFAAMATQVGLATCLLGLAITSSCTTDLPGPAAAAAAQARGAHALDDDAAARPQPARSTTQGAAIAR